MKLSKVSLRSFALVTATMTLLGATLIPGIAQAAAVTTASTQTGSSSRSAEDVAVLPKIDLPEDTVLADPPPPALADLQEQTEGEGSVSSDGVGLQIRADALKEGALSYGARGGLAHRTFEIQRRLAEYDTSLSKAFNFSRLLISAPSGFLIEPPVVSAGDKAVLVGSGGQEAAVADRIYKINRIARIVTASRDWRLYLERDWGKVDPPPAILLPKDDVERYVWRTYVKQGWDQGVQQAEETFESDIDRMLSDFVGMVRYRELLAQGMISPPYAVANDRGVTGGGAEMRVGDRGVMITGQSSLISRSESWRPAAR